EMAVLGLPEQAELGDRQRRGAEWRRQLAERVEGAVGGSGLERAREGQVEANLVEDVRVEPALEMLRLPAGQAGSAPVQLRIGRPGGKAVELLDAATGERRERRALRRGHERDEASHPRQRQRRRIEG